MLCSRSTKRFDIPHEPGEWMELRLLAPAQIRQLRTAANDEVKGLPESERISESGSLLLERVLERCLVAWSYADESGAQIAVDGETRADLDGKTQLWAFHLAIGQEPEEESEKG